MTTHLGVSRRQFVQTIGVATAGMALGAHRGFGRTTVTKPLRRDMGRMNFEATSLGLGGQASLQWTANDIDPVKIILKAFDLDINYFDTSNVYGPSQMYYGKAFRELHLIPGQPGYDERRRREIFLTSKTMLRWAKGGWSKEDFRSPSEGEHCFHAIDDVKRTLTQIFGDGKGAYPPGAYLDMVLLHNIISVADMEALYVGFDKPDPRAEDIGTLAALLDYRDGTNHTGLNPKEEKVIRHLGFSGHHSPPVMIEMIQRDERNVFDGMLVAINANDRQHFNMQYNVIPVAAAKGLGVIGMKVFADGNMYRKETEQEPHTPKHVIRNLGSDTLPSRRLVEYALSTPGVGTVIIGTGHISEDPAACQLQQNLSAAQIAPGELSATDRLEIEKLASVPYDGKTNLFQLPKQEMTPPRDTVARQDMRDGKRVISLKWQTAYAGDEPISRYEIWRDHQMVNQVAYQPQTSKKPFEFVDAVNDKTAHTYQLATVDAAGHKAMTDEIPVAAVV
ncbi:MAG: aldo/keto reductase [Bryobacteraceae bacterium]|jgi:aryl-alcohol dehydrogenase-like predicted oxidoreductase